MCILSNLVGKFIVADMEVDMVAEMDVDKVANMQVDMVTDMVVDKVADMEVATISNGIATISNEPAVGLLCNLNPD